MIVIFVVWGVFCIGEIGNQNNVQEEWNILINDYALYYILCVIMVNMDIKEQSYEFRHPNDPAKRFSVNLNIEEMKKIFKDMAKEKDNKYATNPQISDVMKEMWTAKKSRKLWKP